jgi:hypothetical protein
MNSIRDVITEGLSQQGLSSYSRQAEPIVSALEARETEMADSLVDFAVENGMGRESAVSALRDVGLLMKSSNGTVNDDRIAALEQTLRDVQQSLNNLRG